MLKATLRVCEMPEFLASVATFNRLSFEGIDLGDALGLAATSVGNAGPGIGHFADGNFSAISSFNKWILSFLMIVGRLEIFTVLTPLLPGFWRR